MADAINGAIGGASAGVAAGGANYAGLGGIIGGGLGLVGGLFSDYQTAKAKRNARKQINAWRDDANRILEDSFRDRVRLSGESDVGTYKNIRDNFDPNEFVLSDDELNSFDKSKYNVEQFLNPNAQAIRDDVARTLQHTAAGSAMGHSSGAAKNIVQGVMEKDEQLLRDAREQMNQERSFDYGVYTDFIRNKQNQLQNLQQGRLAQMQALRDDIQFDQQNEDNYVTNRLNLGNAVAQSKAQLV